MTMLSINSISIFLFISCIYCRDMCSNDCSTFAKDGQQQHNISCTIHKNLDECDISNFDETPAKPELISKEWFLYDDPHTATFQRIGLNFSWSPKDRESSINDLKGYVVNLEIVNQVFEQRYFCFHNKVGKSHYHSKFSYDCFGYKDNLVFEPGISVIVYIRSLPEPDVWKLDDQKLEFNFDIPDCSDSRLKRVFKCYQLNLFKISFLSVNNSCLNRSAIISYSIPPYVGDTVDVVVRGFANNDDAVASENSLPAQGNYSFIVDPKYNDVNNFTVVVVGYKQSERHGRYDKKKLPIVFESCTKRNEVEDVSSTTFYVLGSVFVTALVVLVVAGKVMKDRGLSCLHLFLGYSAPISKKVSSVDIVPLDNAPVTIYIVFADDDERHKDVVVSFAKFLEGDLGFNVLLHVYETRQVFEDPVSWMEKSFVEADKVLVIWSQSAAEKWQMRDVKVDSGIDFFTPVLSKIYKDLFRSKNSQKYVFGYFEYCSRVAIPEMFMKKYPHLHYRLMSQFDVFYFHLKGREMFVPVGVVKEKKADPKCYMNVEINEHGENLYRSIKMMCDSV